MLIFHTLQERKDKMSKKTDQKNSWDSSQLFYHIPVEAGIRFMVQLVLCGLCLKIMNVYEKNEEL